VRELRQRWVMLTCLEEAAVRDDVPTEVAEEALAELVRGSVRT